MKKIILLAVAALIFNNVYSQTYISTASTSGLKYPLLETAVGTWTGYTPDADQNVLQTILPAYPRTIVAFWHGPSGFGDPMMLTGDPYCTGTGYISAFPTGTIDRATFGGSVAQNRPWDSYVGTQYTTTPNYDVSLNSSYNSATRTVTVRVTGTALIALSGNWNINAYVVEDSISTGLSSAYNQANLYNPGSMLSCTGSTSWYVGYGNPITSGTLYSHMQVVRAILCSGASIWGEAAFTSPAAGTTVTKTYTYVIPAGSVPKNIKIIGLVAQYGATTSDRVVENAIETGIIGGLAGTLSFTGGHAQSLTLCENAAATSINSLMAASDTYVGTTVTWSTYVPPAHGTLVASYTTTSTGGVLTPTGLSYTPAAGFIGLDQFTVIVADGTLADTTTVTVTVNPAPTPITGTTTLCTGTTSSISSSPFGGTWSSSNSSVATISGGLLAGLSAGSSIISYTLPGGCAVSVTAVVSSAPSAGTITGPSNVCTGATISLTDAVTGGTWTSSTGAVSVGASSGIVTGVAVGTSVITYTVAYTCGTATTTATVTVGLPPSAGTITGATTVCTGGSISLSDAATSGVWAASNGNATVAGSGAVYGVTPGTDVITYTVTNACGSASATTTVTINHCPLSVCTGLPNNLNIYPNPAKTFLNISAAYSINSISISNLLGQTVYTQTYDSRQVQVNISDLSKGVYFVKINGTEVKKFVKE